eukprot:g63608.t1
MSEQELVKAVVDGQLDRVKELLAQGVSAESKDSSAPHSTALIKAGWKGHTTIAEALLAARANVNATNDDGSTALILAGANGHTPTAQALLAAGANLEAKTNAGKTALDLARQYNKPVTAVLLEEAAKVTCAVFPLMAAAQWLVLSAAAAAGRATAMGAELLAGLCVCAAEPRAAKRQRRVEEDRAVNAINLLYHPWAGTLDR